MQYCCKCSDFTTPCATLLSPQSTKHSDKGGFVLISDEELKKCTAHLFWKQGRSMLCGLIIWSERLNAESFPKHHSTSRLYVRFPTLLGTEKLSRCIKTSAIAEVELIRVVNGLEIADLPLHGLER